MMLATLAAAAVVGTANLHLMTDKVAGGAVCLDGGPAGFYYQVSGDAGNANDWQLWLEGGGWCYDEMDCWGRSQGRLGSSKSWAQTVNGNGIISSNCDMNPDFCKFNRVLVYYCDGTSFSGDLETPVNVTGKPTPIYFRGRRILDAVFETLADEYGLGSAKRFIFMGSSAGGLATYLHTDYVHEKLKAITSGGLEVFKAVPISGYFLDHVNLDGEKVYGEQIKYIFDLSNSSHAVNADCIKANPDNAYYCYFAPFTLDHIKAPVFVLNSAYDAWQTKCIYTSKLVAGYPNQTSYSNGACGQFPSIEACQTDPEKCTQSQINTMMIYMTDFMNSINTKTALSRAGNGAFLYSCHTHDTAPTSDFVRFSVDGTTMQQALGKWWASDLSTPAAQNTWHPCMYHNGTNGPRNCNPSCGASEAAERQYKEQLRVERAANEAAYLARSM